MAEWREAEDKYYYYLDNLRIVDPTMEIYGVRYDDVTHACTDRPTNWGWLHAELHIDGYACSYDPVFSAGLPFHFDVEFWPTCGDENLAFDKATWGTNESYEIMDGEGATIDLENEIFLAGLPPGTPPAPPQCYGDAMFVSWHSPTGGDRDATPVRNKICASPSFDRPPH